ncbi:MAG TPA: hypothetical protein HPP77_02590 [Candidatus Hydrogenedentes bacterium]|nr:hypothetical protein [Candidatus Hydrogenedentota bacterium]
MRLQDVAAAMSDYEVVLEPDENTPEWWAGGPSVTVSDDGTFYLAARMREGKSPRGRRGYEIRILKSADGRRFTAIRSILREDAGVAGFERPSIVKDPNTRKYKLYGCAGFEKGWAILKFQDVDDPAEFDARTARPILVAEYPDDGFVHVTGYKDPVLLWDGGRWHMFVIASDVVERIRHFTSDDGETWRAVKATPVMENSGWHNFCTRPASVVALPVGYLFVYEGANVNWRDPVYNIATGLAYSPDLETFLDLTPREPLLKSTTPGDYATWRYSDWIWFKDNLYVYFEAARPNNTNEIRVAVLDAGVCGKVVGSIERGTRG